MIVKSKSKSFPRPMAHRAAPISVSIALGHASANAVLRMIVAPSKISVLTEISAGKSASHQLSNLLKPTLHFVDFWDAQCSGYNLVEE